MAGLAVLKIAQCFPRSGFGGLRFAVANRVCTSARGFGTTHPTMVEGHSVHRVAVRHRNLLVGKTFKATSPNGRFADGAAAIVSSLLCCDSASAVRALCAASPG